MAYLFGGMAMETEIAMAIPSNPHMNTTPWVANKMAACCFLYFTSSALKIFFQLFQFYVTYLHQQVK